MNNLFKLILLITLIYYVISQYSGGPAGTTSFYSGLSLATPLEIASSNGFLNLTLTVDVYRFNSYISFTTRAYYYNGIPMIPGPTLRLKSGDIMSITLINNLQGAPFVDTMATMNYLHSKNTTNIHTHGLHVDPSVDSIFVFTNPGQTISYNYTINSNHAPGIHWYHSHRHGESTLQVMGGLHGAIIVDSLDPTTLIFAGITRQTLLLSHFSTVSIDTFGDPFKVRTYADLIMMSGDTINPNFVYTNPNVQDIYFTNGQYQPYYNMLANNNVIFDVVHSVGDFSIELEIRTAISSGSKACTMTHLATDGVYFTSARVVSFIVLVPASRASFIVSCSTPGTYYLQTLADLVNRPNVGDTEIRFNQNLLTLIVASSTFTAPGTIPNLSTIVRPFYLTDLTSASTKISGKWEMSTQQPEHPDRMWIGIGSNCTLSSFGRATDVAGSSPADNKNCGYLPFPGQSGTTGNYRHIGQVDTVEQLTVWGRGKSPHTIHIHVNHLQIISQTSDQGMDNYSGVFGQIGDWRDTIPAIVGSTVVRYLLNKYTGEIVLHCHFLFHEDMGMMATIYSSTNMTCTFPNTCYLNSTSSTGTKNGIANYSMHTCVNMVNILFIIFLAIIM